MHHVDWNLLEAVLTGHVPAKFMLRHMLAHLAELCPECRQVLDTLRSKLGELEGEGPPDTDQPSEVPLAFTAGRPRTILDRPNRNPEAWLARVRREHHAARREVSELLRTAAGERARKIERATSRFRSRAVAELLLEESRRVIRNNPEEARNLASLVPIVLLWTPSALGQDWAAELEIRAAAWVANSYRVEFRFGLAEQQFQQVRELMGRAMVGEDVHAEVASLEASLRLDQWRLEEARVLLEQFSALSRATGDEEALARSFVQRAILENRSGDLRVAATFQSEALVLFERLKATRMVAESAVNLALFHCEGGERERAAEVLARYEPIFRRTGLWDETGARMIRGRIALAHGRDDEAEELLLAARADLIQKAEPVRAAVVSLDLAVLYLAQGKNADLRRIARLMGSIFEAAELESEALAAVALFQKAVAAETVTEAAIRAWRRQLELGGRTRIQEPMA